MKTSNLAIAKLVIRRKFIALKACVESQKNLVQNSDGTANGAYFP